MSSSTTDSATGSTTDSIAGSAANSTTGELLIAIDAGNSKTDARLVRSDGTVVAAGSGGGFRPQVHGVAAAVEVLAGLVAGWPLPVRGLAAFLAGADLPEEVLALQAAVEERGWAKEVHVANDTFALFHAGTASREGVAVVCGTGINCVGVAADGRTATFPALGALSGDWGGGGDVGRAALWWAVRAEDGRGPATLLRAAVIEHFGTATVLDVVLAVHRGELPELRLAELAPAVFRACDAGDEVAALLVDVLADEIAAMALAASGRLGLADPDVVLGGAIPAAGNARLLERVGARLPGALSVVGDAPVAGAVRYAVDRWGN